MMEYEVIAAEQLKVLKEQFNEPQSLKRLVHIFSDNSMRLLTEMKVFLMDENIAAIRAHAHQLKSSCKIIGAVKCAEIAVDIENGLDKPLEEIRLALLCLDKALCHAIILLEEHVNT